MTNVTCNSMEWRHQLATSKSNICRNVYIHFSIGSNLCKKKKKKEKIETACSSKCIIYWCSI